MIKKKSPKSIASGAAKSADDVRKIIEKVQLPLDGLHPMMVDGLYP